MADADVLAAGRRDPKKSVFYDVVRRGTTVALFCGMFGSIRRWFIVGAAAFVTGCPPPSASTNVNTSFTADALVVKAVSDESASLSWFSKFEIANAPKGEYLTFTSRTAPSTLAGVADFDPDRCPERDPVTFVLAPCTVNGVGDFKELVIWDGAGGPLALSPGTDWDDNDAEDTPLWITIVRRGVDPGEAGAALQVTGFVGFEGGGGCDVPDGPELSYSSMSAGPT